MSVPIGLIRGGGPELVCGLLRSLPDHSVCVINAVEMRDVEVVAAAVHQLWGEGKMFLFRTAASIVRALAKHPLGLFRAEGIEPHIAERTSSFEFLRSLVARGFGYSLLIQRPAGDFCASHR